MHVPNERAIEPTGYVMKADWYQDPDGRYEHRWFDGTHWTDAVAEGGQSSFDPVGAPVSPPPPPSLATEQSSSRGTQLWSAASAWGSRTNAPADGTVPPTSGWLRPTTGEDSVKALAILAIVIVGIWLISTAYIDTRHAIDTADRLSEVLRG
jgi:hypothetical protein